MLCSAYTYVLISEGCETVMVFTYVMGIKLIKVSFNSAISLSPRSTTLASINMFCWYPFYIPILKQCHCYTLARCQRTLVYFALFMRGEFHVIMKIVDVLKRFFKMYLFDNRENVINKPFANFLEVQYMFQPWLRMLVFLLLRHQFSTKTLS